MNETMGKNADILKALKKKQPLYLEFPHGKAGNYIVKGFMHMGKRIILAHERTGAIQAFETAAFFNSLGFTQTEREDATISLMLMYAR
jgi:hypothetical protein